MVLCISEALIKVYVQTATSFYVLKHAGWHLRIHLGEPLILNNIIVMTIKKKFVSSFIIEVINSFFSESSENKNLVGQSLTLKGEQSCKSFDM